MALGDKYLQKKYRQKKPKLVTISTLSLLQSYEPMLRTLKVLNSSDQIVAADAIADGNHIQFKIYTGGKSRTRKD